VAAQHPIHRGASFTQRPADAMGSFKGGPAPVQDQLLSLLGHPGRVVVGREERSARPASPSLAKRRSHR
jgi:hypothetical protein